MERLIRQATRALSVISNELGVALAPRLEDATLEKLELIQVSSSKVLLVASVRGGVVRTVYVDLRGGGAPGDPPDRRGRAEREVGGPDTA